MANGQNKAVQAKVRHYLKEQGITGKASNTEKAHAFAEVCADALFGSIAPEVKYCDGANDHGIDFYHISLGGQIVIAQCKYDSKHDPRILQTEIAKTADFISDVCQKCGDYENMNKAPNTVIKSMPESQNNLAEAVRDLYSAGMQNVLDNITYVLFMAADAIGNCEKVVEDTKLASHFGNVRIVSGGDIINLYDSRVLNLRGVPELRLGVTPAVLTAAREVYADINFYGRNHEIFTVPVAGDKLAAAVVEEFKQHYWYDRLFANNVRSFLKNKELKAQIGETIANDPTRFLDYNNGITLVCSSVKVENHEVVFSNAVIVNGGQTTANIYEASKHSKVSDVVVSCQVIVEDDNKYRKQISVRRNTQKPVTATDIRSIDEKAMRLQSHLKDEDFCLILKSGETVPKTYDKNRQCRSLMTYAQTQAAFSAHQPVIAREKGSPILMDDRWFDYILSGNYAVDNSPAAYAASVMVLRNYLDTAIDEVKKDPEVKDMQGIVYPALYVLGIQADMLYRASLAKGKTFEDLVYLQPKIKRELSQADLSEPFVQYEMVVNREPSASAIELLRPFVEWLYHNVQTTYEKITAVPSKKPVNPVNITRKPIVSMAAANELCTELSQCTYETCLEKYPYLRLLMPVEEK